MEDIKHCPICLEAKPRTAFQLNPDGSVRKHVCKLCYGRKYRAKLKIEMLEAFGWKCQCCGEDHPYFLSLDHINKDGNKHRAEYGNSSNNNLIIADAKREGWPKDRYQLLCMNCNTAKGYYGECPHQNGMLANDVITSLKSRIFHTGKKHQNFNYEVLRLGPASVKGTKKSSNRAVKKSVDPLETIQALLAQMSPEDVQKFMAQFSGSGGASMDS